MLDDKPFVKVPDVTGYIFENAECILKDSGIKTISVIETSAPVHSHKYGTSSEPALRVLRQKFTDADTVELVVCRL